MTKSPKVPYCKNIDLSAWGFEPGSNWDAHGVHYSKALKTLFNGRQAKGHYKIAPTVTKIRRGAFATAEIVTLTIPAGVDRIPAGMCANCKQLKSARMLGPVMIIETVAFLGCESLTQIQIPEGVELIEGGAFFHCQSLAQIDIPASIKSIGSEVFAGCSKLKSVTIPNGCRIEKDSFPETCTVMTQKEAIRFRARQLADQSDNTGVEVVG